jgi:hypothetical protein
LRHYPHIRLDKHPLQKAGNQWRMVSQQQTPGRVLAAQGVQGGVIEVNKGLPSDSPAWLAEPAAPGGVTVAMMISWRWSKLTSKRQTNSKQPISSWPRRVARPLAPA